MTQIQHCITTPMHKMGGTRAPSQNIYHLVPKDRQKRALGREFQKPSSLTPAAESKEKNRHMRQAPIIIRSIVCLLPKQTYCHPVVCAPSVDLRADHPAICTALNNPDSFNPPALYFKLSSRSLSKLRYNQKVVYIM